MSELTQREINELEDELHRAESDREDAADTIMWSLRTLMQNSPDRYAPVVDAARAGGIDDFGELVDRWVEASRRANAVQRELP